MGKEKRKNNILLNQLLRSGTSIGANIHEANYAASKADFINKLQKEIPEIIMIKCDTILDVIKGSIISID